jgi:RNA polymerase sigma-19 factor, ECF subfamily
MSNGTLLLGWRHRWHRNLLRFLRVRVSHAPDIDDVAQETYFRLMRARNLSHIRNPEAYMIRVASHVALEWRQHEIRAEAMSSLDEHLLVDERSPEIELDLTLSQQQLDRGLAALSPATRAVLLLRLRDDRSCKDIARELDLSERQVKRYLAQGYERLREAVGR